jgi:NAD(P)-dependent dehydrogenase (short-subunit alcohol dehydrogenase family)
VLVNEKPGFSQTKQVVIMTQLIALVSGANRGIGLETCRQLAQRDVQVILTSRDPAKGQAAVDQLATEGLTLAYHQLDAADPDSINRLHDYVEATYGRLDILVNNAGILIDERHSLLALDYDVLRSTMETNAYGPLLLTQAFVPLMRRRNYGRIVNLSSGIGELSELGSSWPAYRLSKIFLNIQTRIIAGELEGSGILINAMCPGWVRSDMGGSDAPKSIADGADTAVWLSLLPDDGPQGGYFRDRQPIDW